MDFDFTINQYATRAFRPVCNIHVLQTGRKEVDDAVAGAAHGNA